MASKVLYLFLLVLFMCVFMGEASLSNSEILENTGVCNRTEMETVPISFNATKYNVTRRIGCYRNKNLCMRFTKVFYKGFRNETRPKIIFECCKGYLQNGSSGQNESSADIPICNPICEPPCKYGVCEKPNTCKCDDGYELNILNLMNQFACEPKCSPSCEHGACIAPNKCLCNSRYEFKNGTCQPVCLDPCVNGTCVGPDTCECLSGYKKTDNICRPVCSKGCYNGSCISPEVCQFDNEWELTNGTAYELKCEPPCGYGVCNARRECDCDFGYERKNGICVEENIIAVTKLINGTMFLNDNGTRAQNNSQDGVDKPPIHWGYYMIPIAIVSVIVVIVLVLKRKSISGRCTKGNYNMAGTMSFSGPRYTNGNPASPDIAYSEIIRRQNNEVK